MNIISDKKVQTRKPHKCWGCMEDILIGTTVLRVTSVDGGEIATVYWCDRCADFLTTVDWDEDGWGFGELIQTDGYPHKKASNG